MLDVEIKDMNVRESSTVSYFYIKQSARKAKSLSFVFKLFLPGRRLTLNYFACRAYCDNQEIQANLDETRILPLLFPKFPFI